MLAATNFTFPLLISSLSISLTNVSVWICSELLLRIVPTIKTGFESLSRTNSSIQLRINISLTICSATSLESVSFQCPLKSVASSVDMRVTVLVVPPHPINNKIPKITQILKIVLILSINPPFDIFIFEKEVEPMFLCQIKKPSGK